jgi:hypothetical protein
MRKVKALVDRSFYDGWGSWHHEKAVVVVTIRNDGTIEYPEPKPIRGYGGSELVELLDRVT